MFLLLLLAASLAVPPSDSAVQISDAVRSVVVKHKDSLTVATAGPELELLAGRGDPTAAALLGELYWFAGPAGADPATPCDYFERAGEHASALHNLATCYFDGNGRTRDRAKARALYARAAELGFAKAYCAYGNMLISGDGGGTDVRRGLALCKEAADFGNPDAQTDYGGYLLTGKHVPKAAAEARKYLEPAAGKGQRNAAFLLGQMYWNGDGVAKDRAAATGWWKVAHENGRPDAARFLALEAVTNLVEHREKTGEASLPLLENASHWLAIAAQKDPDPRERATAAEQLAAVRQLIASVSRR